MARIADPENLRVAFWKASKGKRGKADCRAFHERLDENLAALGAELLAGDVSVGDYHYFTVHDPKERLICAASFRERVLHHALMNVCEPVLERAAVFDSYACRKGKGRMRAVARAQEYARSKGWFLKMDIRKYFDSIHQTSLRNLLGRKFKDPLVLGVFDRILGSYHSIPGRGLPIGNLTSQHFANFYLAPLDRFIEETLRPAPSSTASPAGVAAEPAAIPSGAQNCASANTRSHPPGASRRTEFSKNSGWDIFWEIYWRIIYENDSILSTSHHIGGTGSGHRADDVLFNSRGVAVFIRGAGGYRLWRLAQFRRQFAGRHQRIDLERDRGGRQQRGGH